MVHLLVLVWTHNKCPSTLFSTIWILVLTVDTSHFQIFCLMWDFAFCSAFPTGLRGFSCPSLAPFNIAPTAAHHIGTFPNEKRGMKREHPALFSSFFTPWGVFVVHSVAAPPPTLPTHHPCGLPSDCDQKEGLKILNSSHLANALRHPKRAPVWDGGGEKKTKKTWWVTEKGERLLQWAVSFYHLFSREHATE